MINHLTIFFFYSSQNIFHNGNIFFQDIGDGSGIAGTDLLPHNGGRRSDSGNILKATCSQLLHLMKRIIIVLHQIDQTGSNQMRDMTDGCYNAVMFFVIQYNMLCAAVMYTVQHQLQCIRICFIGGCQYVPGIFQQMVVGMLVTTFLGTSHGMSANELAGHAKMFHCFVDFCFCAAHIGNQTIFRDDFF